MSALREPVTRSVPVWRVEPLGIDLAGLFVIVGAVEQHDTVLVWAVRQDAEQIVLRAS